MLCNKMIFAGLVFLLLAASVQAGDFKFWAEKRSGKGNSGGWEKRHFRYTAGDEYLCYYKDEKAETRSGFIDLSIDAKLTSDSDVTDILHIYSKKMVGFQKFKTRTFHLKFPDPTVQHHYMGLIQEWIYDKDGAIRPSQAGAQEAGAPSPTSSTPATFTVGDRVTYLPGYNGDDDVVAVVQSRNKETSEYNIYIMTHQAKLTVDSATIEKRKPRTRRLAQVSSHRAQGDEIGFFYAGTMIGGFSAVALLAAYLYHRFLRSTKPEDHRF